MDLGAGAGAQTFFKVTLPGDRSRRCWPPPSSSSRSRSTTTWSRRSWPGSGATTLPLQIYSMVKSGISPEINAVSTMLLVATALLLLAAFLLEQGRPLRGRRRCRRSSASRVLGAPVRAAAGPRAARRPRRSTSSSGRATSPPETLAKFEARHGVKVNVDLYDSNEALLAKLQAGNAGYDVVCPSDYSVEILLAQGLLRPLDHSALPHLVERRPGLPRPALRPRQRATRCRTSGARRGIAYRQEPGGRRSTRGPRCGTRATRAAS